MRLKALRLSGFKSFADRTELVFPAGITCIVGPNGCGKSNVVDAIKWVLGEQRPTALRGSEMQDVIFGGTSARKSLGLAEVSLVFENQDRTIDVDYEEVEVTRRLYRDGRSEYLLNRATCRLRDLRELLMDTGSGPGALTFMEQGRIDQILRESVEERRAVFEEAAGIAKYKARRREALRRLEKVEADLLRVSDVVQEKQRLVRSLKVQAGRAERYQALVEEMRRKRLLLALHRYGGLLAEREAATARVVDLSGREETARAEVREALAASRRVEEELTERRAAVARVEQEVAGLEGQIETAREKSTFAARLASELDGKIRWYTGEIQSSAERLGELSAAQEGLGASLRAAEAERTERQAALAECERALETARAAAAERRSAAQRLAERAYQNLARQSQLTGRRSKLEAEARSHAEQRERLLRRETAVDEEQRACAARLAAAEQELVAAGERAAAAQAAAQAADRRVQELDQALHQVRERVTGLDRDVTGTRSRVDVLRALADRMEGVGEGARKLIQEARRGGPELAGVRGLLVELVETDAARAGAVETALGPYATAVVVETMEDAERAIAFLRERRLGRCIFLPLDTVRPVGEGRSPEDLPGEPLLDAVRCPEELRPALRALLADAVSVEDLASARRARAAGGRLRFVADTGVVLEPTGALQGGGAAGGAGLLQRRTELRELVARLEEAAAHLATAREELAATETALREARREVAGGREAVRAAEGAVHRARSDAERSRADAARLGHERGRLGQEAEELAEREERARADAAALEEEAERAAAEQGALERARSEAARGSEEADRALRTAEDARSDARVHAASVVERCSALRARAESAEVEIRELEEGVAEAREELAACEKRRKEAEERGREAHVALERAQRRRDECVNEVVVLRHDAARAHTALEERRGLLEEIETRAHAAAQELHRFRMRENEARLRVENLIERVRDELGVELHEAFEEHSSAEQATAETGGPAPAVYAEPAEGEAPPELDVGALESELTELRVKIERMGAVNLEALHQLGEAESEAARLGAHHDDLTRSRESLLQAIRKIDAESRELFTTTFEAIRANFRDMFRRLFGGGKADVFLVEGQDVLEAGIEIVARPPGKELRSISLMSGGERTMTAVALMFSIYMAKPSPFCLLDEVDAALDESNVDRFVSVLQGFARQSQFIVVTHNKRTMGSTDTIFGISMPEPGVSRKIAVRLDDIGDDGQLRQAG